MMKSILLKGLVLFLTLTLGLTPGMIRTVFAAAAEADEAAAEPASKENIQAVQQLAKNGYLGDKKDFFTAAKALTEDDITDAVIKANDSLAGVDVKTLKAGSYRMEDLKVLQKLLKDKSAEIRARKLSAWKYQTRLDKVVAALTAEPEEASEETINKPAAEVVEASKPAPMATPVPAVSREELGTLKDDLKDLIKKVGEMQAAFDKKTDTLQKSDEELKSLSAEIKASNVEVKASNTELKSSQADNQEQLKLVKRLLDRVQDDLKKTDDHLDQVAKKAAEKSMTDVELQQELNIMHKDLRDNTQDVSILKQQVSKLDKSGEKAGESPLDSALSSKWLSGGALVVGITALIIALTKK